MAKKLKICEDCNRVWGEEASMCRDCGNIDFDELNLRQLT